MRLAHIGTAGWSIPRNWADSFPAGGSVLERYASRFSVAEINSSFHRPHRRSTWERWRDSTPPGFRFSAKLPRLITHQHKLVDCNAALDAFLKEAHGLGPKLAVLLVQLPPKHSFDKAVAGPFFAALADRTDAGMAVEPRHASWFTPQVDDFLTQNQVARVAADPALCEAASRPGGWPGLRYWRLHGSPVIYRSSYSDRIAMLADALSNKAADPTWCMFDNTASSAAIQDALQLQCALEARPEQARSRRP